MRNTILVINGPNLNLLGTREPDIYGYDTLADIEMRCQEAGDKYDIEVDFKQSNAEEEIISWVQQASEQYCGVIINAAAFTHTSVAIMDALLALKIPVMEVHLSNIFKRESFRHHSYISPAATGVICGLGGHGYVLAIEAIAQHIDALE